ncbi:cyclodeaminase [Bacillus thermotolerans]|mgnify:CR=1 FL=1|uniref:cyclodeaminase n=1 Tax=Bacillus thermotolerans TaxID=1221996 RepID=UPI00057C8475|nr:cyclodeaminase [Bacillus thermotolerans]KKB34738.1 Ornithine cyclodeaminase [Bacillus thermotolerans]
MIIFTEEELRQHVHLNLETIHTIEEAFTKLENSEAVMPPIMRVDVHDQNGEIDVKTAYLKGREMLAIKVSAGFFSNYQRGLPSGNGLMMLISTETGVPQAFLLDNGYLTDIRTAAAGALAAKYLAKENIRTVGVIGAGSQARYQIRALKLVRKFHKVLVYARSIDQAKKYAEDMAEELQVQVEAAESAEAVVKKSDIVVTTTPAKEPLIKADWLHPGLHITAMGSDAEHKQELDAEALARADKLVCDTKSQCARLGELHHAFAKGVLTNGSAVFELGQLTSKKQAGRESDEEVTICDLTGTGVQDTAIALFAYREMTQRNLGLKINNSRLLLNN